MLWLLAGIAALVGGITIMAATLPPWVVLIVLVVLTALYWRCTAPPPPAGNLAPAAAPIPRGGIPTAEVCSPAPKPAPGRQRARGVAPVTPAPRPTKPALHAHRSWKDRQDAREKLHKRMRATAAHQDNLPLTPEQAEQLTHARSVVRKSLARRLRPDPYMLAKQSEPASAAKPFSTQHAGDDAQLYVRTHRRGTTGNLADRLTQNRAQ